MKLFSLFLFVFCLHASDSQEEVLKAFTGYRAALLGKQGAEAYSHIDKYSRDYYDKAVKLVTGAQKDLLKELKPVDKLLVLSARVKLKPEDVKGMSGRDFFIKSVENGWINSRGLTSVKLANFNIQEKRAFAWAAVDGQIVGTFLFTKEDKDWKFDVTSALEGADAGLRAKIVESKMTADEYIMSVLRSNYGDEVTDSVWEPLK